MANQYMQGQEYGGARRRRACKDTQIQSTPPEQESEDPRTWLALSFCCE